jgi:hypothetical protein
LWIALAMPLLFAFAGSEVRAITGGGPTGCIDLCPADWVNYIQNGGHGPCVVVGTNQPPGAPIQVIAGSIIDCDEMDVRITGRDLAVTDGKFWLKARSVLVQGKHVTAGCNQHTDRHGFRLDTAGDVTVGTQGKLDATCAAGGGEIIVEADGNVSLGGQDLFADGAPPGGPGGRILVRAKGDVTTSVLVRASNTGSAAGDGGTIEVEGEDLVLGGNLFAQGASATGGEVALSASGNLQIGGEINANCASGDGGQVSIEVDGTMTGTRPISVHGSSSNGTGGIVQILAGGLTQNGDIVASGGAAGGTVQIETRGGPLALGVTSGTMIDATRSSSNPGDGGDIIVRSDGGDVRLGSSADLKGNGAGSTAYAGTIEVGGVDVVLDAGSRVRADAVTGSEGGDVRLVARGSMTINGEVSADNGGAISLVYRATAPSGSALPCPCGAGECALCEQSQDGDLDAPCGDGIRRVGSEQCDGPDLGGESCQSQSQGSGTLLCAANCTFDASECTGS